MNPVIILNTLRERSSSVVVILILAVIGLLPRIVAMVVGAPSLPEPDSHVLAAWILGAGIIGKQVRSGVLQLVFVRPVTRSEYVYSKYFALATAVFVFSLIVWLVSCASFWFHPAELKLQEAFMNLADHLILSFGIASVIVFLSSLRSGYGDVGLIILLYLTIPLFQQIGAKFSLDSLKRAAVEIERFLTPNFSTTMFGGDISWFSICSYFSTITLCLVLAILVLNRKELSYAE